MKMKNYYISILALLAILVQVPGCSKKPTDYKSFLNGQEIVYPGVVSIFAVYAGNGRLMLAWHPSSDPSISKYTVYWNNKADSVVLNAGSHNPADTIKCIISNLAEYDYTFFIYSYDAKGNVSVPTEIDNAHVYGPVYQAGLHNRPVNTGIPAVVNPDGSLTVSFLASIDSINITTRISYTNTSGVPVQANLSPDSSAITLPAYKTGTQLLYQSSFVPRRLTLDTFYTLKPDTIPAAYSLVICDKSLFRAVNLPHDMQPYDPGSTYLSRLWDGNMQPRDYPNVFHSDGANALPQSVTFDMGKVYTSLSRAEETGRTCCHNPVDFEIWTIADTTGAISQLAPNNSGWKADVQAKGWTLLKETIRTDDGVAPLDIDLGSNPPPARFIIIRVLQTATGQNYVNMSQVTFWNKQ
jgi:hypothetical protein